MSQIDYYRYTLLSQKEVDGEFNRFQILGRLLNEWVVDMFSRVEDERLLFIRRNQSKIVKRKDTIAAVEGIAQAGRPGHIHLPGSSVHLPGSRLYQLRLLSDALAIVARGGKPTLFITFTCNPNWPEIKAQLAPGQIASDRPNVVCTVFHQYLARLLKELRSTLGSRYSRHRVSKGRTPPRAHLYSSDRPRQLHSH